MPERFDPMQVRPVERDVYSVSRLNREARMLLEGSFALLWVEGELSNLSRPSSGHLYFTLKDDTAQVRCAMFRTRNMHLGFTPRNGAHVLARARVSLYEPRGDYQLIVEHLEETGDGALRRAFEALKQRLAAEGLFDAALKRPLPALPRRVGVVTSPSGAAIRDVLSVLRRRFPALPVVIYPVPVQGSGAAEQIARAIAVAGERRECDVLIVTRGGGSLEDLWPFNDEAVARAIRAAPIPVVSGVGHEIDVTIADFAADQRAPTPSAAAELVSPDAADWLRKLHHLQSRLVSCQQNRLRHQAQRLDWLTKRLRHPGQRLQDTAQRLDLLEQRLLRAHAARLEQRRLRLETLAARLRQRLPVAAIRRLRAQQEQLARRLENAAHQALELRRRRLAGSVRALEAVSPLATLSRGYAIVTRAADGAVVRAATDVRTGDRLQAQLGRGRLTCDVMEVVDV